MHQDDNNIPAWAVHNRNYVQKMMGNLNNPENAPRLIPKENQLEIGNEKIQLIMNENGIDTIDKLEQALSEGVLFKSPMHKSIIKNFIIKAREDELKEAL